MSKRCQKENTTEVQNDSAVNITKNDEQKLMLCTVIGSANVSRWNRLKANFCCKTEEDFVKVLLDFAEKHLKRDKFDCKEVPSADKENGIDTEDVSQNPAPITTKKKDHKHKRKKSSRSKAKHNTEAHKSDTKVPETLTNVLPATTCNGQENKIEKASVVSAQSDAPVEPPKNSIVVNIEHEAIVPLEINMKLKVPPLLPKKDVPDNIQPDKCPSKKLKTEQLNDKSKKHRLNENADKRSKKHEYDVRKAPELNLQKDNTKTDDNNLDTDNAENTGTADAQSLAIKIKLCSNCDTRHLQDQCPLQKPYSEIVDSLTYNEWYKMHYDTYEYEKNNAEQNADLKIEPDNLASNKYAYSYMSLPKNLYLEDTTTPHGLGVYAKTEIDEFTQFGPLIGKVVKEVDIPEDCSMKDIFEIINDNTHIYFSTENNTESNWLKYVRPAASRDLKNLLIINKNNLLYFNAVKKISVGEELFYWQDDMLSTYKKREKTICGGCNMTFLHPLYYRIHCSVFHDVRYSLTIRKYHCKVCGEAVLGKENIMKHASELHNGQGAYQCQFCKKFFLRLNYLEMHRTYGCSSNPHRSRPLCDFCGRKFCQPQKLKVHIKRMHSDMSEVLKEFQCKNCFKILGSRAALQRHLKEVHQKQVDGACTCSKCGKLFQNKSNLKIHMLTHSGIKPFKCAENNCVAAFTTKQCLQFHYKKVHGFTEEVMPKIERSVDYTFEAYSGGDDQDPNFEGQNNGNESNINCSDQEDNDNSTDDKNIDDPPALHSPVSIRSNDQSSNSNTSPPLLEAYTPNMKILSKGSKKWIGEDIPLKSEICCMDIQKTERIVDVEENETYTAPKLSSNLNTFSRHESSNASLLVEAALDSVCSDPNIDIDVGTTPNCTDTLVNNLYTLSHSGALADVTYNHSVDVNDSRDINLISPSVNDQISVTDEINDELRQSQNIGLDYSSFHQEDFSPPSSPSRNNFVRDYINTNSPQNGHNYEVQSKNMSPANSPPRYDFGPSVNAESDDSNGIGAQNLSLHNPKESLQLDLSIYKSHYSFDNINFMRKDIRPKFDDQDRKQIYILDPQKNYNEDTSKFGMNSSIETQENLGNDMIDKDFETMQDSKHKESIDLDLSMRSAMPDIRNKFELDLDLRKSYDIDSEMRRTTYDSSLDDFRMKSYELDNLEIRNTLERNKTYENLIEEFRADRNFEPLVLNPSELQGLDMSARSYHNYPNLNRYHHIYSEVDRPSVDLRLNYTPPPPTYSHTDILRVVSLDLTPPGRHSVDLSLRSHQITNSRLLSEHSLQSTPHRLTLDQSRLLSSELTATRHLGAETRLISDMSNRILSDHTTNRILSNDQLPTNRLLAGDQRILSDDTRLISEQPRLLDQSRILSDGRILPPGSANGSISPVPYSGYSVSPSPYHPTALAPRPHAASPNPPSYHHYSAYY